MLLLQLDLLQPSGQKLNEYCFKQCLLLYFLFLLFYCCYKQWLSKLLHYQIQQNPLCHHSYADLERLLY